jgi:type I restriction enzyme S subunit
MGICAITEKRLISNQTFIGIIPSNSLNREYLYYLLTYYRDRITMLGTGVTIHYVSKNKFQSFQIPLPPLPEQKKISYVLSTIQEAKAKTDNSISALRELKKSLMKHLYTYGPVSAEDAEKVKLKETEIGEIPKEWRLEELKELITQAQYGLSLRASPKGQYPIIGMNHLLNGRVILSDLKYVNLDEKAYEQFRLNIGDILFNRTNSIDLVGKTSIFDSDLDCVFASYLIRVVVKEDVINPAFLSYFMNREETQNELKKLATRAVGQSNISATRLKTLKTPVPPLPIQKDIIAILSAVDQKIEKEQNKRNSLEALFKSMLHDLMTAKIRVNYLKLENAK